VIATVVYYLTKMVGKPDQNKTKDNHSNDSDIDLEDTEDSNKKQY